MTGVDAAPGNAADLLSDRIRNALTDAIAAGDYGPGASLDEQALADRYGVSRTPVREALRQLSVAGLVKIRPRRGAVVAPVTIERIMEMFEATAEIEALCARLATHRMTPLERSAMLRIHTAAEEAARAGDLDQYDARNRHFHEALYQGTHNQFLAEQAMAIRERLGAYRRTQLRQDGRLARSHSEHGVLIQAIMRGDGDEAAKWMRAHLLNASGALLDYFDHGASPVSDAREAPQQNEPVRLDEDAEQAPPPRERRARKA
ncbi:GntR family transcriptional regulator [Sphingomonas sp. BIUV-7]|uniref:GntR family transcriptional regulator n=1 Tax=Sphingomonas natans TaxID=3063330 RepID=A0ABT8Y7Z7_9SPHN|nr:GntR family transcriptional regulator [Sphingomonas sp. BIUV-7]MDO6414446.1 GntR family transcriptional regulator [Sphingomonas sp. BIUV-7]